MLNKARLNYLLREILLKKGVKNLLEFTDLVSEKGLKLANDNSLSPANLQNSLKGKDRGFFNSNKISRMSFYKTVTGIIKKENPNQEGKNLPETEGDRIALSFRNPLFHFGHEDNVGGNKISIKRRGDKESFVEKLFWYGIVALVVAVAAIVISHRLGL